MMTKNESVDKDVKFCIYCADNERFYKKSTLIGNKYAGVEKHHFTDNMRDAFMSDKGTMLDIVRRMRHCKDDEYSIEFKELRIHSVVITYELVLK